MGTTTVVTTVCDLCNTQTVSTNRDTPDLELYEVFVGVWNPYCDSYPNRVGHFAHWCRPCCEKTGLLKPIARGDLSAPAPSPVTPPTIEEMLRELIRDETHAVLQGDV